MIAPVKPPHRDHFDGHADEEGSDEGEQGAGDKASGHRREGCGEIGADHVERAMRQVDQVHYAEDQGQPGGEQKQQHAQLHAIERLLDEIQHDSYKGASA